jgi:hypothetical protein
VTNPEWFLSSDLSALDGWIQTAQPTKYVKGIVLRWIAMLPDTPWQAPSQPFPKTDPRYDRRGARLAGTRGIAVIYTVDEVTGQITIDAAGAHFMLLDE